MKFGGRGILLDVEGTTSSIRFVYDEMFPYVRRELTNFLQRTWDREDVRAACDQIARDAGADDFISWAGDVVEGRHQDLVATEVTRQMDQDAKTTGLKALQGLIWQAGFESGQLVAHLYDDVLPALHDWRERKLDLRIYSSGSVKAQNLFFGHTQQGDIRSLFSRHYDTQIGSKKDRLSYTAIAADWAQDPRELLFVSDVAAELDAASDSGMFTALSCRPGNPPAPAGHGHPEIASFDQITIVR